MLVISNYAQSEARILYSQELRLMNRYCSFRGSIGRCCAVLKFPPNRIPSHIGGSTRTRHLSASPARDRADQESSRIICEKLEKATFFIRSAKSLVAFCVSEERSTRQVSEFRISILLAPNLHVLVSRPINHLEMFRNCQSQHL